MPEPTRRDVLKTGAAAAVAGLAGCSDSESSPTPDNQPGNKSPQNSSADSIMAGENINDAISYTLDTDEILNSDAAQIQSRESLQQHAFTITRPQEIYEAPDAPISVDSETYDILDGSGPEDILTQINDRIDIYTLAYDMNEEEIIEQMEDTGFERSEAENVDSRDWEVLEGERIDTPNAPTDLMGLVKDNNVVYVPTDYNLDTREDDTYRGARLSDPEAAAQLAIDTYDGELESFPEGNDNGDKAMATARDYLKENDLEELENPHEVTGGTSYMTFDGEQYQDKLGGINYSKITDEDTIHINGIIVDENYETEKTRAEPKEVDFLGQV